MTPSLIPALSYSLPGVFSTSQKFNFSLAKIKIERPPVANPSKLKKFLLLYFLFHIELFTQEVFLKWVVSPRAWFSQSLNKL